MRCIGLWRRYINIIITILDIINRTVFYLKHKIGNVRTSQEKHYVSATSQEVNSIYRFVTMVY
jgi:hypothetical protein